MKAGTYVKIYTDGSYRNNKCSFGFVIIRDNKVVRQFRKQIMSKGHDNYYAELKAIEYAIIQAKALNVKAKILTDFLDGIKIIQNKPLPESRTHYIERYETYIKKLKRIAVENENYYTITYVKSHSGIFGNEYVDKILKVNIGNSGLMYKENEINMQFV